MAEQIAQTFFAELGSVIGQVLLFAAIGIGVVALFVGGYLGSWFRLTPDISVTLVALGVIVIFLAPGLVSIIGVGILMAGIVGLLLD